MIFCHECWLNYHISILLLGYLHYYYYYRYSFIILSVRLFCHFFVCSYWIGPVILYSIVFAWLGCFICLVFGLRMIYVIFILFLRLRRCFLLYLQHSTSYILTSFTFYLHLSLIHGLQHLSFMFLKFYILLTFINSSLCHCKSFNMTHVQAS